MEIVSSHKSITVRSERTSVTMVMVNGKFEFHTTASSSDQTIAQSVFKGLKSLVVNFANKKVAYAERLPKVAKQLESFGATSLRVLVNKMNKLEARPA